MWQARRRKFVTVSSRIDECTILLAAAPLPRYEIDSVSTVDNDAHAHNYYNNSQHLSLTPLTHSSACLDLGPIKPRKSKDTDIGPHLVEMDASLPPEINIITLNCWGLKFNISKLREARLAEIGRQLALSDPPPNIVCLQEVWAHDDYLTSEHATSSSASSRTCAPERTRLMK